MADAEVVAQGVASDCRRRERPSPRLTLEGVGELVRERDGGAAHTCILASRGRPFGLRDLTRAASSTRPSFPDLLHASDAGCRAGSSLTRQARTSLVDLGPDPRTARPRASTCMSYG